MANKVTIDEVKNTATEAAFMLRRLLSNAKEGDDPERIAGVIYALQRITGGDLVCDCAKAELSRAQWLRTYRAALMGGASVGDAEHAAVCVHGMLRKD